MTVKTTVDARKERIDEDAAWTMLESAAMIKVAKGKNVQTFNPKSDDKTEILKHVMGPSGNLRAPALRVKETFFIGFSKDLYVKGFD